MTAVFQLVGLALALLFGYLAFGTLEMDSLASALDNVDWTWVLIGVGVLSIGYIVRIFRWQIILQRFSPNLTFVGAAGPFIASFALNNVLPLRAGDMARGFAFQDQLGASPSQVTAAMVLERLLDLMSLILLFAVGLVLLSVDSTKDWVQTVTAALAPILAAAVLVLAVPLLAPLRLISILDLIARRLNLSRDGLPAKVFAFARNALNSLAPFRTPRFLIWLFFLSVISWAFEGALFFCVAKGMGLFDMDYGPWFSHSSAALSGLFPSTPGHVGTFDYFGKQGMMAFGATDAAAAVMVLVCHAAVWLTMTIPGGLYLLHLWGFGAFARLRALKSAKTTEGPS